MAVAERDILDNPGKYNIDEIAIISYRPDKEKNTTYSFDIKGIMAVLNLHENIFRNVMSGSVIVYDTNDIRTIFPLTGLERLSLKFNTPGLFGYDFSEETGTPMHIYKVDKVTKDPDNDTGQLYKIYFTSPEAINSQITSVSRAYAGPIENAVNDILRNKKYLNSKKPFLFENTATNAKYVIPSMKPLKAINFLSSQCVSGKYNNSGYLFYENKDGFHFRSIESLMAMGGAVGRPEKWGFRTQKAMIEDGVSAGKKDIQRRMQTVIKYEFDKHADTLENMMNGMYANRLIVHDAFNKTIKTHDFNYIEDFEKGFHLETIGAETDTGKHILPEALYDDKGLHEHPNTKKMVVTETSKVHNDYEFVPTKETLQKIVSQRQGVKNMNLSLLVYGNTILNAGDVIRFNEPLYQTAGKDEINPYTSGRYIIMAIKHTISIEAGNHTMVLRCYKDSVGEPYPTSSEPLIEGKDNTEVINVYEKDIEAI